MYYFPQVTPQFTKFFEQNIMCVFVFENYSKIFKASLKAKTLAKFLRSEEWDTIRQYIALVIKRIVQGKV